MELVPSRITFLVDAVELVAFGIENDNIADCVRLRRIGALEGRGKDRVTLRNPDRLIADNWRGGLEATKYTIAANTTVQ